MATTKITDLLDQINRSASTDTMLSVGIGPQLCKYLAEHFKPMDQVRTPLARPADLVALAQLGASTEADVQALLSPQLSRSLIAMDGQLRTYRGHIEALRALLPKLNLCRGHNDAADKAIDDICALADEAPR